MNIGIKYVDQLPRGCFQNNMYLKISVKFFEKNFKPFTSQMLQDF